MQIERPNWKVLLIGGHSGVGKTTLAQLLARHFAAGVGEVDDFRLMLQYFTPVLFA